MAHSLTSPPPSSVAVVGSGLAGLAAAFFLQQAGHTVELFERGASAGMDLASVDVDGHRVDVPFRVFTPDYYPSLHALYTHLGIATAAADYSLAFTRGADGTTLWSYTNLTLGDFQVPIPDSVAGGERLAITRDWTRLLFASACAVRAPHALRPHGPLDTPMGRYLAVHAYGAVFARGVLLPFLASVFTCSVGAAANYPANAVLHFVAKAAFGARLRKARGGVSEVCRRLLQAQPQVHYGASVARVTRDLRVVLADGTESQAFDAVVVATPADTAARLVADVAPELALALARIKYEDAHVVTHRDPAVMPVRAADWRGVNIMGCCAPPVQAAAECGAASRWLNHTEDSAATGRAMASHWLNYVEDSAATGRAFATPLFQTVDPRAPVAADKIAASAGFHRSLLSVDSQHAVDDIHRAQGLHRVWVVGAYAAPGVPLLEGCVRSAADVASALDAAPSFALPPLKRRHCGNQSKKEEGWYEVGLAPGMARGESVHAFYEHDAAGTFVFKRPGPWPLAAHSTYGSWLRAWLAWFAFVVMLPVLAALLAASNTLLTAVVGAHTTHRIEAAVLDAMLYLVCSLCLAIRKINN
ncbi:hypothetical protein GGF42_002541 [Coemansia sp. RSA 2424]|nr:hypothetical protein GGF42_002541 [Coemansia sp. RSA 2424]